LELSREVAKDAKMFRPVIFRRPAFGKKQKHLYLSSYVAFATSRDPLQIFPSRAAALC
jgi:hypothetical protein